MIRPNRRVLLKRRVTTKESDTGRENLEPNESVAEIATAPAPEAGIHALTGSLPPKSWKRYKPSFPTIEAIHARSPIVLWDELDGSHNNTM
ncbi:hypothetical protein GCM10011352_30440 [Marinobacterium zhoushanense]|uniref:Uncharacterized protein n=1 Tax=Marinobacterium zhoushanense TaxID=1679163 RepID=A0ABQ1KJB5_9GAMM|nr:hypothetical protein GCM10011352_30440 [Marinobacterium zhoushanense]